MVSAKRRAKRVRKPLAKKAQKAFRGYPIATIAYYGPDDKLATKVAVGIVTAKEKVAFLERWYSEEGDVRFDKTINQQIVEFIERHNVRSVVMSDGIIGCPHEEGIDYPEGESCPKCPYWANRDRQR